MCAQCCTTCHLVLGDMDDSLCCIEVWKALCHCPVNSLANMSSAAWVLNANESLVILVHVYLNILVDKVEGCFHSCELWASWVAEVALQYLASSLTLHINEPAHYADCAGKELHTVCFIIRLQASSKWIFLPGSSHFLSSRPADRQLSECNMAPTAGQAPPQSGHLPSWLYWIKHPVMYEAGAAPEGAELPHLLPTLCAYDLLSKLYSY